ncbi:MAG TPA: sulfotransferase [Rubrobacteraceae bacterium]|nr:sulfotransferase [Rubrobacteraceae bacterium]
MAPDSRVTVRGGRLDRLLAGLHVDLGRRDHRDAVFLAGSGRSGTTWISDVINYGGDYRFIFEPFCPAEVGAFANFTSKQYLRPADRREEYLAPAREVLTGGLRSPWTDRFHRAFLARRRLIKDIRANLLLGWMRANFPGMPIILLLRHPLAVVASRLALRWKDNLSETLSQAELLEDFLRPMEIEIRGARDAFERHLFLWCIDNYVPLMQLAPGEIHLAFYEHFVADPEAETGRLFAFLGHETDEHARRALARPSPLARRDAASGVRPLDAWRRSLTEVRLRRAVEILGLFGLDRVYGDDAMPDPSGAVALMREERA